MRTESGKTAVITGGAGGLGRALADQLLKRGWRICLIDLPGEAIASARSAYRQDAVSFYGCDLADEASVSRTCSELLKEHPTIDLVIYNAGITQIGALNAEPISAHRRVFDVNYFGALFILRLMVDPIRKSKGTHLAISSVAGFSPLYLRTSYAASKHALEGLFKSLRAEELSHGVSISIAAPSFVATNIDNPQPQPGGIARPGSASDGVDYMSPAAAAKEILDGLERRKPYIPVGRVARLAWRLNRFVPQIYFQLMMKRMKAKEKKL